MRSIVVFLAASLASGFLMLGLGLLGSSNLPVNDRVIVVLPLAIIGVAAGSLWASALMARPRSIGFSATAGMIAGAGCGATYALTLSIAFVHRFGGVPVSVLDGALVLLAYPVFAFLGGMLGSAVGAVLGGTGGILAQSVLRNRGWSLFSS